MHETKEYMSVKTVEWHSSGSDVAEESGATLAVGDGHHGLWIFPCTSLGSGPATPLGASNGNPVEEDWAEAAREEPVLGTAA